jgi:hypothetical protein
LARRLQTRPEPRRACSLGGCEYGAGRSFDQGLVRTATIRLEPYDRATDKIDATESPAVLANVFTLGVQDLQRERHFCRRLDFPKVVDDADSAAFELRGTVLALLPVEKLAVDWRAEPDTGLGGIRFTIGLVVRSASEIDRLADQFRSSEGQVSKEPVNAEFFEGRSARSWRFDVTSAQATPESTLGVGIIGISPVRGWAATAHIPALRALPNYEIRALSAHSALTGRAAGELFGVNAVFADHEQMVTQPDIDVVAVTVKVPHHRQLVSAALAAGKAVYCEWPLGRDLDDARAMATLAAEHGVSTVVGLQARQAPRSSSSKS